MAPYPTKVTRVLLWPPPYKGDLRRVYRACRHLAQPHSCGTGPDPGPPEQWGSGRLQGLSGKEALVPRGDC